MTEYYQIEGTDEIASSEEEAKKIAEQYFKEMKIPVNCKGILTFEDYRIAYRNLYYLTHEVKNGIFYVSDEHVENPNFYDIEIRNDTRLVMNFHRFYFKEFLNENIDAIKNVFDSSIGGEVVFESGNHQMGLNSKLLNKLIPDTLKEVKISGSVTLDSHLQAMGKYIYLANELSNTIFYDASEIHSNIICEDNSIHFYCHRFFPIDHINNNLSSIKELVRSSDNAHVVFEIISSDIEIVKHVLKR